MSVPSGMQLAYFGAILGSGVVFLLLAFFLFLPVLILSPSKFAITFSLGSALVLASVGALRGWKQQAQHMMSRERLPFTAGAHVASAASPVPLLAPCSACCVLFRTPRWIKCPCPLRQGQQLLLHQLILTLLGVPHCESSGHP